MKSDDIWKLITCVLAILIVMVSCHTIRLTDGALPDIREDIEALESRVYNLEHP